VIRGRGGQAGAAHNGPSLNFLTISISLRFIELGGKTSELKKRLAGDGGGSRTAGSFLWKRDLKFGTPPIASKRPSGQYLPKKAQSGGVPIFLQEGKSRMKRFTEGGKWGDPWFRQLGMRLQWLWLYICDQCDGAGVIELDWDRVNFESGVGAGGFKETDMGLLGDRVRRLAEAKWFIPKFIKFQYGELSGRCQYHVRVMALLKKHGLLIGSDGVVAPLPVPLVAPLPPPLPVAWEAPSHEDKDQDQDLTQNSYKDLVRDPCTARAITKASTNGDSEKIVRYEVARRLLGHLAQATGKPFREVESNLSIIAARLAEAGVEEAGCRVMINRQVSRWKGTPQEEYLRPITLFAKTKFDSYYSARDLPVMREEVGKVVGEQTTLEGFDENGEISRRRRVLNPPPQVRKPSL